MTTSAAVALDKNPQNIQNIRRPAAENQARCPCVGKPVVSQSCLSLFISKYCSSSAQKKPPTLFKTRFQPFYRLILAYFVQLYSEPLWNPRKPSPYTSSSRSVVVFLCVYSQVLTSNATEASINYASWICVCIDFNKSHFLHAPTFVPAERIAGVPADTHTRDRHAHTDFQLWGRMKTKGA